MYEYKYIYNVNGQYVTHAPCAIWIKFLFDQIKNGVHKRP